jgi:hypothetical protein
MKKMKAEMILKKTMRSVHKNETVEEVECRRIVLDVNKIASSRPNCCGCRPPQAITTIFKNYVERSNKG